MILAPVLATVVVFVFAANLLTSILLYFGLPSLYLALRNKGIIAKSLRFAAIFFIPLSLFFDTLAAINGAYVITDTVME